MDKGWLELESDPGLFTLLLEDFGVKGVQVEEIYDLQKPIEGMVYGFIFLFKWIEERRSRRKIIHEEESFVTDEEIISNMYFAQQVIPNSCATHALLSVLLNQTKVDLGDTLTQLKYFTQGMNSEDKGFAIGNMPELATAHNSHARPEAPRRKEKQQGISAVRTMEAFHFVSYVPINGRLFELDGLKPYPIDHGPWGESEEWTEKFRRVITERLGMATGGEPYHDIRFNLMAVVPDKEQLYETKLKTLKTNRQIVLEALQQMVKVTNPELSPDAKGGVRAKAEPILTRSVAAAAREALANHQAEKAAAAAENGTTKKRGKRALFDSDTDGEALDSNSNASKMPAVLDCHSYAKSPLMDVKDEDDVAMETEDSVDADPEPPTTLNTANGEKMSISELASHNLTPVKENAVKIHVSVSDDQEGAVAMPTTVATTDVTKPLSIQTRFAMSVSPTPSSESTDTASEVGSLIHSPAGSSTTSAHSSPNVSFIQKLASKVTVDVEIDPDKLQIGQEALLKVKADLEGNVTTTPEKPEFVKPIMTTTEASIDGKILNEKLSPRSAKSKFSSAHGFTPKDLLALLKTVENEIKATEQNLRDEKEKKKKYKVDDCRRTHNYDQFVFTFLSMLAQQGHLTTLVEQTLNNKRRPGHTINHSLHKIHKPNQRRRSRPKKKR